MRRKKVFIAAVIAAVAVAGLFAVGVLLGTSNEMVSDDRNLMIEQWRLASWFDIPYEETLPDGDGVIVWQDPGMEAHIRFLLGKPEGDIHRSDVWNIHVLCIEPGFGHPGDSCMVGPAASYRYEDLYQTAAGWHPYSGVTMPEVESLADLQYFDNLQVLRLFYRGETQRKLDISGVQFCDNLRVFQIWNGEPLSLLPLADMEKLEYLDMQNSGLLDLQPLAEMKSLRAVSLKQSEIQSLEPLSELPGLTYLDIREVKDLPSLEPLSAAHLTHLDLSRAGELRNLDFVAQMEDLICLGLADVKDLTQEDVKKILDNSLKLEYLDISGTPAAKEKPEKTERLKAFVY